MAITDELYDMCDVCGEDRLMRDCICESCPECGKKGNIDCYRMVPKRPSKRLCQINKGVGCTNLEN